MGMVIHKEMQLVSVSFRQTGRWSHTHRRRKDRFPKFHQQQSPAYWSRLLIVHESTTGLEKLPHSSSFWLIHYTTHFVSFTLLSWKCSCCFILTFLSVPAGGDVGLMEGQGSGTSPRLKLSKRSSLWLCSTFTSEVDLWVWQEIPHPYFQFTVSERASGWRLKGLC